MSQEYLPSSEPQGAVVESESDERIVIASCAVSQEACLKIVSEMDPSDFAHESSRESASIIRDAIAAGAAPTRTYLISESRRRGLDARVVEDIATTLRTVAADPANIGMYLRRVKEHAANRDLSRVMTEMMRQSANGIGSAAERLDVLAEHVTRIGSKIQFEDRRSTIAESSKSALDLSVSSRDAPYAANPVTGFPDLDRILNPMFGSSVIVLAARPSMGKSALALSIAKKVASKYIEVPGFERQTVILVSLEMTREQLAGRLLASEAKVEARKIVRGELSPEEQVACEDVIASMRDIDLVIYDDVSVTPSKLKSIIADEKSKAVARGSRVALVVVDYLQLMPEDPGHRNGTREEAVASISRGLKKISQSEKIPLLVLSQLNRKIESRQDTRPVLSDLRESGAIEQDADTVVFLHNEYLRSHQESDRGRVEVIIAKQRNGGLGSCLLSFDDRYIRFGSYINKACITSHYPSIGAGSRNYFDFPEKDDDIRIDSGAGTSPPERKEADGGPADGAYDLGPADGV